MEDPDEQELVEKAKTDKGAFAQLYEKYYPLVFNYVLHRTGNIEVALDLTSETFFKVLKNLNRFRWRDRPFSAWLYRIASHEISDFFKERKNLKRFDDDLGFSWISDLKAEEEFSLAEKALDNFLDFLSLREKLAHLPQKYQEVIVLRFFEKREIKEISQILQKPEGTVKSLLHRGLKKLKKLF